MPKVRRSSTRASGRGEHPMRSSRGGQSATAYFVITRYNHMIARTQLLFFVSARTNKRHHHLLTHPHCCFHATIHGLTELRIFNNISMLELRTKVTDWLTTASEQESEGLIERWAIQRQAVSTHIGIFRTQRPSQTRKQWRDHCQAMTHHKVLYLLAMTLCSSQSHTYTIAR